MVILYILLISYMLLGLYLLESAWKDTKQLREVDEARDSQYPAYRRLDVKKWQKWKFYFGAMTFMPIRVVLTVSYLALLYLGLK